MHAKTLFVLFISCTLVLAGCGKPAVTPAPVLSAAMSELQGTVEKKNPTDTDFSAAAPGDEVDVQGQVRTGEDSRVRLDLSSGTIIRVASSTLFTLEQNEAADDGLVTRLKLFAGKLWVVLNGGSIDVDTPSGLATVRGSYMMVWIDPGTGDVWVDCLEGWCQAGNDTANVDMLAGQGTILYAFDPAGSTPPPPPLLRTRTQEEIDEFLANNPELSQVMDAIIATASALPSPTGEETPTPTPTLEPVADCFALTSPADGASLASQGLVTFSWESLPEAAQYAITFTQPNGYQLTFPETGTSHLRYLDSLPAAGTFQWQVTAFDAAGTPLCTAGPFSFSKPAAPTPTFTKPAPTPSNSSGNAIITYMLGPNNFTISTSMDCFQSYKVYAVDPDGIDTVWIVYDIYDNGTSSWLGSGGFSMIYIGTSLYESASSVIGTSSYNSTNGKYDIDWHFEVLDVNEGNTVGPTYHFTDTFGCSPF